MKVYTIFYYLILSTIISFGALAQTNQLYSRFALGTLQPLQNVANLGMGGTALADNGDATLNYMNPASYGFLRITTFQMAGFGERFNVSTLSNEGKATGTANISYLNIGMPISKKAGISFGLLPYTRIFYNAQTAKKLYDTVLLYSAYNGRGGLQKVYFGIGGGTKRLKVGANMNIIFGNNIRKNSSNFTDSIPPIYSAEKNSRTSSFGLQPTFGVQYNTHFGKNDSIKFGATYAMSAKLKTNAENYTVSYYDDGQLATPIEYLDSSFVNGTKVIPAALDFGVNWQHGKHWQYAIDVHNQDWTQYRENGNQDSTNNELTFRFGVKYNPAAPASSKNYIQKMTYSAGFYTGENNLRLNGQSINTTALTFGAGFPIKRQYTQIGTIHFAVQSGVRGTTDNGLVREGFTRFTIGANLSELWFQKGRYK